MDNEQVTVEPEEIAVEEEDTKTETAQEATEDSPSEDKETQTETTDKDNKDVKQVPESSSEITENNGGKFTLTENIDMFKMIVKIAANTNREIQFCFTEDAMIVRAMDVSQVAIFNMILKKEAYTNYELTNGPFRVSAPVKEILKFTKALNKSTELKIDITEKIELTSLGNIRKNVVIPTLIDIDIMRVPELEFKARIELSYDLFTEAIITVKTVDETACRITVDSDSVKFGGEGDSSLSGADLSDSEDVVFGLSEGTEESQTSKYGISFLNNFLIKEFKTMKVINLEFGNDYPCRLSGDVGDLLTIEYIIAPRVESDKF